MVRKIRSQSVEKAGLKARKLMLGKKAFVTLRWLQCNGRGLRKEEGLKDGAFQEMTLPTVLG